MRYTCEQSPTRMSQGGTVYADGRPTSVTWSPAGKATVLYDNMNGNSKRCDTQEDFDQFMNERLAAQITRRVRHELDGYHYVTMSDHQYEIECNRMDGQAQWEEDMIETQDSIETRGPTFKAFEPFMDEIPF
jgi:hypothetical protein